MPELNLQNLQKPPLDRLHDSFVGFVGSDSGQSGKTKATQGERRYQRITRMLRVIAKDADLRRQLECEIEERAGILQFDAGLTPEEADTQAEEMTLDAWLEVIDATDRQAL